MKRKYRDSQGRAWYALHVRTGEECDVAMDVYALGDTDSLLPVERYILRGGAERERVLMPGYVFVGCMMTPDMWQRLRHLRGVLRILGDPYEAIPEEQMASVMALYWHGVSGTKVVRVGGVTQVVGGAIMEVAHEVTCADERQGVITVAMELPGGTREVTMHAEFITPGQAEKEGQRENEKAGAESGGLRIPHDGNSEERRQAVP